MAVRTILSALIAAAALRWHACVLAEEEATAAADLTKDLAAELDGIASDEAPKAEGAGEGAGGEGGEGQVDPEAYAKSALELQEKLGQLKALLDAKGEGADPALKERLGGLQKQLEGLGLNALGEPGPGSNRELTEFITGCVTMTARRVGLQRPSTIATLRNLAEEKWTRAEASKEEFFKMTAACITEFTEQELQQWKAGKMSQLPKSYVDMAKKPESEKMVTDLEESVWAELVMIAKGLVKELGVTKEAPVNTSAGMIAAVPMIAIFAFLGKKFMDMKKRNEAEAARKEAKAAKKNK